jgi:hypothetical protein
LGATGEVNNFGRVAGEISDGGIDLAESNLHSSSVKGRGAGVEMRAVLGRVSKASARLLPVLICTILCWGGHLHMDSTTLWLGVIGLVLSAITICAIYYGPISALRIQRELDDEREMKNRKLYVFKTLMTYRATPLNINFVQALNLIDVEFLGTDEKEKAVREAWKELLDHFNSYNEVANPLEKSKELTATLLAAMGQSLGYHFDRVHLKKGAYYPAAAFNVEQEQHSLRKQVLELLDGTGTRKLPVAVFEQKFPDIR